MSTIADHWRHQIRWHISQAEACARSCLTTTTAHEAQIFAARATAHAAAAHAMSSGLQAEDNEIERLTAALDLAHGINAEQSERLQSNTFEVARLRVENAHLGGLQAEEQ